MTTDTVTLWTHHPSTFQVNDPELHIDWTLGEFWNQNEAKFRYREVLPRVHEQLDTTQFLWCCTIRGGFERVCEEYDLVEWELNVPRSRVRFYSVPVWEKIVYSRTDNWDGLWLGARESTPNRKVGALVFLPLESKWINCHGQLPLRNARHVVRDK